MSACLGERGRAVAAAWAGPEGVQRGPPGGPCTIRCCSVWGLVWRMHNGSHSHGSIGSRSACAHHGCVSMHSETNRTLHSSVNTPARTSAGPVTCGVLRWGALCLLASKQLKLLVVSPSERVGSCCC